MATVLINPDGSGDFTHINNIGLAGNEVGTIVKLARGSTFRGVNIITAFGSASSPLMFTCYGDLSLPKPIVSGRAIVAATWVQSGSDWYITVASHEQLYIGFVPLLGKSTQAALAELTQFYDSSTGRIYIRSSVDPNTIEFEITDQASALRVDIASDGVEVNNLEVHGGNTHGIFLTATGVFTGGDSWKVESCDIKCAGTNLNSSRASDSILLAGQSNTGLVTNAVVQFNTMDRAFNNALETHYTDGMKVLNNTMTNCGGGIEFWKGNQNAEVAYNRAAKIDGTQYGDAFQGGLFWIKNFTTETNVQDANTVHHNIAVNCQHGFKLWDGTGHTVEHNILWGIRDYGLLEAYTIGAVVFSNNIVAISSDLIAGGGQGRFVDQGVPNATALLTGDNNAYYTLNPGTSAVDGRWRFDAGAATIVFTTHQTNAAPNFDQASIYTNTEPSWLSNPDMDGAASSILITDYEPVAGSSIDGIGASLSYTMDIRRQFIDSANVDVGAVQRQRFMPSTSQTMDGMIDDWL